MQFWWWLVNRKPIKALTDRRALQVKREMHPFVLFFRQISSERGAVCKTWPLSDTRRPPPTRSVCVCALCLHMCLTHTSGPSAAMRSHRGDRKHDDSSLEGDFREKNRPSSHLDTLVYNESLRLLLRLFIYFHHYTAIL